MKIRVIDYLPTYSNGLLVLLHDVYGSEITKETLEEKYISDSKKIMIAVEGDSVLGCSFIEERFDFIRPEHTLFITYVAVSSNHRKKGIGRMLFNSIFQFAKDNDCSAIELTSANYREEAHAFYKALGFTEKKTTIFIKETDV